MIWESKPWKNRLLADADIVERWAAKPAVTERRSLLFEQKIFLAAYTIRKLTEAKKLSTSFDDRSMHCIQFPAISDCITKSNSHNLAKMYDFEAPKNLTISARRLMDIVIHSFVFCEWLGDELTLDGFLVTSDKKRYSGLWLIEIARFVALMRNVGTDNPSTGLVVFDDEQGDYQTWLGVGPPPRHIKERMAAILAKNRRTKH
jgi:hypothetical protein